MSAPIRRPLVAALGAVLFIVGQAAFVQASVIGGFLTGDGPIHHNTILGSPFTGGGEDQLNDESRAAVARPDGMGGYSLVALSDFTGFAEDDIIFGIVVVSEVDASGALNQNVGSTEQIAIVFAAEVGAPTGGLFPLVSIADSGNPFDLRNLLHADISTAAGLDDDSVFVALGSDVGTSEGGAGVDPLNFSEATPQAEIALLNNSNDWYWELTGGIVTTDDFWQFLAGGTGILGSESGGFSVQSHDLGSDIQFLPVDVQRAGGAITTHDVTLFNGTVVFTSDGPWIFEDQAAFIVNVVPEPTSILSWIAVGAVGLVGGRRARCARNGK